jgi:glycerophosphoryl diester phosphodiesterase
MKMKGISATPSCGALMMELMHARTNAHMMHLKTRSYSAHKALGKFYDEIVDLIDSLAEAYQGRHGLINFPEVPFKQEADAVMMLKTLRRYIDDNRMMMVQDSELQNIIDEILALMDSTLYKLEFLS